MDERSLESTKYHIEKSIKISVRPLDEILRCYLAGQKIDFLNVDVEGLDLDVLQSNDWSRYRPKIVLVEILRVSLHKLQENQVVKFMEQQGYALYAKQVNTVFFKDLWPDNSDEARLN